MFVSSVSDKVALFLKPIRQQLDLISMTISLTANTVFLTGKLFSSIPAQVTRSAFVAMNSVGLLYLDWQVSFTLKVAKDCEFTARVGNWSMLTLTAICVVNAVSDLFLMLGGLAASLASWAQHPAFTSAIYTVLRPWGVTFLFVAVGLDIANFVTCSSLSSELAKLSASFGASRRARNILNSLQGRPFVPIADSLLASRIRYAMDKDTLQKLLETTTKGSNSPLGLLQEVKNNVDTQLADGKSNLGLRTIGYVGLALCKAYPDTLIQAITLFVTSLLYTMSRAFKKILEYGQQVRIGFLANS